MEKVISSILAVLIPLLITFFSKRNKDYIRRNLLDEAQKKLDFLNSYYEVSIKVKGENDVTALKFQLADELMDIKIKINSLEHHESVNHYDRLTGFQKLFITFKPASSIGWLWAILFYGVLLLLVFAFMGFFVDEQSQFKSKQFFVSIHDSNLLFGMGFFIALLLLFRWLALSNYKHKTASS